MSKKIGNETNGWKFVHSIKIVGWSIDDEILEGWSWIIQFPSKDSMQRFPLIICIEIKMQYL